jgi:RNA polymerase-binding transcription factor DksA
MKKNRRLHSRKGGASQSQFLSRRENHARGRASVADIREGKPPTFSTASRTTSRQAVRPFTNAELKKYKGLLLKLRSYFEEDIDSLEKKSLHKSGRDATGDLSNLPLHPADVGTDVFEQDFSLGILETENIKLKDIDEALERIKNKNYGICEECLSAINPNRLKIIPYTSLCIKCQEKMEKNK